VVAVGGDGIDFAQLFDFSMPEAAGRWRSLNDSVMGGVSDGAMVPVVDQLDTSGGECHARFTGVVRMERNGGFASVRASLGSGIDLSAFKGRVGYSRIVLATL